ncbi:hypothetical protein PHYPSEUDO_015571 [Phytophthora pseudosyringae]|uniref:Uncharacterized protein n=1 Tax=Phytophthora pseudosyringae TaxID=221518 RepID=A0A8T1V346_9STRA|nr:hypothetical protein PHYPSEUDO_015571 [Phytophthora pseudosyringae]
MKPRAWPGRKSVIRLAAVAPHPEPAGLAKVQQAWRSSRQGRNDGDDLVVPGLATATQGNAPVFEMALIEELPAFDAAKTLKTMLLTQDQIRRLHAFRIQWWYVIACMLQLGNLLMLLTTAAPRRLGSVMALLAPILQFPGMMFIVGSMRIEMLFLLFGTYDFWYFTVNNIVFGVCFAAMLRDIRIIVVLVGCAIVQISIGADALVGDRRQIFLSSVINCGTHFAMLLAVFSKRVDDNGNGEAFVLSYSNSGYGFSIRETLMNTQLNMILHFGRLVYRNWWAMREQDTAKVRRVNSETSYIPGRRRCVSYYCTVGLRQKNDSVQSTIVGARRTSSVPRASSTEDGRSTRSRAGSVLSIQALQSYHTPVTSRTQMPSFGPLNGVALTKGRFRLPKARSDQQQRERTHIRNFTKIQLQFVPVGRDFNAYKTLVPGFGRLLDRALGASASHRGRRMLLNLFHTLGYVGMTVLVLGALVAWVSKDQNLDHIRPGLAQTQSVAFIASLTFCGVFFASYQRQLLSRLYSSFNFIFLSTKLTVASLALCQFFAWDRRVAWVWGAWLWMQWTITLDALPPSAMRLLAFRRSSLMLSVLAFELVGLVILSLELFALDRWIVPNRAVVDRVILGRHVQMSTLSALVSRLWTIFLWDCKLMWFLSAALRRQRRRRLSAIDASGTNEDDEGERLLLTGRVEYFYEWASHTRPRNAKSRWSKGFQILRASQAMLRRRTRTSLRVEGR